MSDLSFSASSAAVDRTQLAGTGETFSLINITLVCTGMALSLIAYKSLLPTLAAGMFFIPAYLLLMFSPLGGSWERRMFARVFAVGWVMLGVAGIYAELLGDQHQLTSDASYFYDLSVGDSAGLLLHRISELSEGAFAIVIWREVYDAFAFLGFPKDRYIGVLVNVTAVAFAGVLAIKIARYEYGNDSARLRRLILLVSCCGLLWLFAGIHLRDGVVFLAITLLVWVWTWFLNKPGFGLRLWILVGGSILFSSFLVFLRTEFYFIPFAIAAAGVAALMLSTERERRRHHFGLLMAALGLLILAGAAMVLGSRILEILVAERLAYAEHAARQHSSDSLGMSLIVNQPLLIRMVLGTIYLYVFPIPVWVGFQLDSAYNLFRSFNALFFYGLNPLLLLSIGMIMRNKRLRTSHTLFLLFCALGFSIAVAITSLEMRHFGGFLVPVFVIALLPDLTQISVRRNYRELLAAFLTGVLLIHLAWLAVSFLR